MKSTPMLMSGPLVVPTLAGWKTHTCRPVKGNPDHMVQMFGRDNKPTGEYGFCPSPRLITKYIRCPFGTVGDQIWIRETWAPADKWDLGYDRDEATLVGYRADGQVWNCEVPDKKWLFDGWKDFAPWFRKTGGKWRPSTLMPRWASRITLEVTDLSVFRIQDITEDVAKREGIAAVDAMSIASTSDGPRKIYNYRNAFRRLWTEIYGAESWAANPWVWGIGFKRVAT